MGRLLLTWRRQQHPAAPWTSKQPYSGTALLAPHGEGPRKGGLTKARLRFSRLASRGQRASCHAVRKVKSGVHQPEVLHELRASTICSGSHVGM